MLQGRKLSFGLLKDLGEWYRTLMSMAVCAFFAWINFVARAFAQRTGKAKALRKKRLEVQAKHKHGPVVLQTARPMTSTAAGSEPAGGNGAAEMASTSDGGLNLSESTPSADSSELQSRLRQRPVLPAEPPE